MNKKDANINIRIDKETRDALNEVATVIDVPVAQISREALREKVAKLRKTHPKLKRLTVETA